MSYPPPFYGGPPRGPPPPGPYGGGAHPSGGYRGGYGPPPAGPSGPSYSRDSYAGSSRGGGGGGHSIDPYYGRGGRDSLSTTASYRNPSSPMPSRDSFGGRSGYDAPSYLPRGVKEDPYGNDYRRSDYGGHDPLSRSTAGPKRASRDGGRYDTNERSREELYNKRDHWLLSDYDEPIYGADSTGRFGEKSPGFEKAKESTSRRRRSSLDDLKERAYSSKQQYRGPTTEYGQGSREYEDAQRNGQNGMGLSVSRRRSSSRGYDDPFAGDRYGGLDPSSGIGNSRRTHTYGDDPQASLRTRTSPYDYKPNTASNTGIAYGNQRFASSSSAIADIRDPAYNAFRDFDEREPAWPGRSQTIGGAARRMSSFGSGGRANGYGYDDDEDPGDIHFAPQSSRRPRRETQDNTSRRIETEITDATGVRRRNSIGSGNGRGGPAPMERDRAVSIQRSPAVDDLAVSRGSSRGDSSAGAPGRTSPARRRLSSERIGESSSATASRYGRKGGNEKVAKLSSLLERAALGKALDKYDQQPWEKVEGGETTEDTTISRKQLRGVDVYCWRASTHIAMDAEAVVDALRGPESIRAYDKFCREAHVVERIDDNTQVYRAAYDSDSMLSSDRDFVLLEAVNRMSETGNWVIMTRSVVHPRAPEHSNYVRGEVMFSGYVVIPARSAGCTLVSLVQVDPKGWLPAFLANSMAEDQARKLTTIKHWLHTQRRRTGTSAARTGSRFDSGAAPAGPVSRKRSGSVYNSKDERFDSARSTERRLTRDRSRSESRQESAYPSDRMGADRSASGRRSPGGQGTSRW